MSLEIENIKIPYSAQFYRIGEEVSLTRFKIKEILDLASSNKQAKKNNLINTIRQSLTIDGIDYKFSIRVYPSEKKVQFLDINGYIDIVYAYILIIEFENNVVIFKKSVSNISTVINKYLEPLRYQEILNVFDDEQSHIQRMSTRNMTISDQAILGRTLETHSYLKGMMSMHSAGKSIPKNLRFKEHNVTKAVTASTARIIELAGRDSIEDLCKWSKKQVETISQDNNNDFIEQFSQPIGLNEVLEVTCPKALLLEVHSFLNEFPTLNLFRKTRDGTHKELSDRIKQNGINFFENILDIKDDDGEEKIYVDTLVIGLLKRNDKSLTFVIPLLQKIYLEEHGEYISLQKYLISNRLYSIVFDKFEYMYFRGECFIDKSGESEMKSILAVLEVKTEITRVTSEKGTFSTTSTSFDSESMFAIVEELHSNDEYVFCDDLGNEWCDHVTINTTKKEISFIHSKANDVSVSASKMHEVVGQGIKNLGNMFFSINDFKSIKKDKFLDTYTNTQIDRIRHGALEEDDISKINEVINDYTTHRQCILSCSFLSKSQIKDAFARLKDGEIVPGNIYQLYWIISSFIHACRDMNVIPKIYCKP